MDNDQETTELTAWCANMARLLDLPLDKADRREIVVNLRILKRQMDLVGSFALDDREDPAPQFRA